jgi:hypothetical protein
LQSSGQRYPLLRCNFLRALLRREAGISQPRF